MSVDCCRLCKVGLIGEAELSFPPTPLANEFLSKPMKQDFFPLEVAACTTCNHYQLTESIDPERLFKVYSYAAGHSAANINHFKEAARHQIEKLSLKPGSRVLDIASNDGTLLSAFKEGGMEILGIDPAENIVAQANREGIPTIAAFFTASYAEKHKEEHGLFDLITANNVFAHVPDLKDFAMGVHTLLGAEGVFSFEVSYFVDVCDKALFDTIYHEHSSYHTVAPLISFFEGLDMELFDVEHLPNHGGSIRVYVRHKGTGRVISERIKEFLDLEKDMKEKVALLRKKIDSLAVDVRKILEEYRAAGKSVAIFGAPAKATTLVYAFGLDTYPFLYVVEDAPLKQGTYTPGNHIPIFSSEEIAKRKPDVLLVLAWNFADSIIEKHQDFRGTWIIPLPELRIISV